MRYKLSGAADQSDVPGRVRDEKWSIGSASHGQSKGFRSRCPRLRADSSRRRTTEVNLRASTPMKFVHLADHKSVPRIVRNGIRLGDGRHGRGVYAVPLMNLPRSTPINEYIWKNRRWKKEEQLYATSEPKSSLDLWQWLVKSVRRQQRPIAVIFDPSADAWRAELYLECWGQAMARFAALLAADPYPGGLVTPECLTKIQQYANRMIGVDLRFDVCSCNQVGGILRHYVEAGHVPAAHYDDMIEIVFPRSIPRSQICSLIPLSRTNRQIGRAHV